MHLRIPTFIRSEARVALAFAAVTLLATAFVVAALLIGDERRVEVSAAWPPPGIEVPGSVKVASLEFSRNVDRAAVESRLSIMPSFAASLRWHGSTLDVLPDDALAPGAYTLTVAAGPLGRGGERLQEPFVLPVTVRKPSVVGVTIDSGHQSLVQSDANGEIHELLSATNIVHFAPSPDGQYIAVIVRNDQASSLVLIDTVSGQQSNLGAPDQVALNWVDWAPDGQSLLVTRSDVLPAGGLGAARAWLVRIDGQYVGMVDSEGEPALSPRWSPDASWLAYVAPATSRLIALQTSTLERVELGSPRSSDFDWSPTGDEIAFDAAPDAESTAPLQQVRVRSLDLRTDLRIGQAGEIFWDPHWVATDEVAMLWRETGPAPQGTQVWFLSLPAGDKVRAVQVASQGEDVSSWAIDPPGEQIVVRAEALNSGADTVINLVTNDRTVLDGDLHLPTWLP